MYQRQIHEIKPLTTAHLAQTMTLLHMSIEEIKQQIDAELSSNPALEIKDERRCPTCNRLLKLNEKCPICSLPAVTSDTEPVVFVSSSEEFYRKSDNSGEEYLDDRDFSPSVDDLPAYVLKQVFPDLSGEEQNIAVFLLANIDDDGLLNVDPSEIAIYFHKPLSYIDEIRGAIQRAEPVGVCSVSPQEALLVQLEMLAETKDIPDFSLEIVRDAMDLLSKRQISEIANRFDISPAQVQEAIGFISDNLNPFPARAYWGDVRSPADVNIETYRHPDIIIKHMNDDPEMPLIVEIIMPIGGTLRVNPLFRKAVKESENEQKAIWKEDLDRASLFVKCLQQRNHTMKRLMFHLVKLQMKFITQGPKYINPITRVQLSKELEVHESTISRAVSKKTVQLPSKQIIPLASFFDRSLNVRTVLREIISNETKPLSDAKLAKVLAKHGHFVARRTVAKYRAMEGILPAHLRRIASSSMPAGSG